MKIKLPYLASHPFPLSRSLKHRGSRGFALISSILIMSLLVMIAMGMLSLSTVEVRSSQNDRAMAEAQANARMALMIAIGELQKQMGPDQRISANGDILSDPDSSTTTVKHPHWTGVWNSWRAGDSDSSTNPDTPSEHRTIAGASNTGMAPTYDTNRKDHFREWLVSLDPTEAANVTSAIDLSLDGSVMPDKEANSVQLVGDGSLGTDSLDSDHVSARLLDMQSDSAVSIPTGRYAWWVGDESQKARIMDDSYQLSKPAVTLAEKIFRHQAPGSTGTTTVKGLEDLTDQQQEQLDVLLSRQTLELVDGAKEEVSENFHHVTPFSYSVLADVREGGLKRDLSTLLERDIDREDVFNTSEYKNDSWKPDADDYMLYKFDTKDSWSVTMGQEMVPIHDLAAYYQMYGEGNRLGHGNYGVKYRSRQVRDGIQLAAADYGTKGYLNQYMRQYSSLYRNPVPIKVQFLMSMAAVARAPGSITAESPNTHKLHMGITPSITLWNPTNLPMVMNFGDPNRYAQMFRMLNLPINIRWIKNGGEYRSSSGTHMTWATQNAGEGKANIFSLYLSGTRPIVFEPGEVKVLSLPYRPGNMAFRKTDRFEERHEVAPGWDPSSFLELHRSDRNNAPGHVEGGCLLFKSSDKIAVELSTDGTEVYTGPAMAFFMIQTTHQLHANPGTWHFRQYQHMSRVGKGALNDAFNNKLMAKGFAGGVNKVTLDPRSGSELIARAGRDEIWPFMQFALMAGTETSEASNGGDLGGRKFASRPFLHSTAISPSNIDRDDFDSFYNYGWNWWIQEIDSVLEANVQVSTDNQGYYGGGYTPESGTTHVVQQEVPVVPPMSIASLSHAHLGGFSLAVDASAGEGADGDLGYYGLVDPYLKQSYHRVTAAGQGGMFPHTLQAIGNSYAHPHIPADKAYENWTRTFSADAGARSLKIVDHSYLANKALWDDYFFSSMTPTPGRQKIFEVSRDVTAKTAASNFFFEDEPLPNRRMVPYKEQLDFGKFNTLFTTAEQQLFTDGLADKIAAYLMVEGPFNVNSTSVEAWKIFLSSLKGKKVSYLDKDTALTNGVSLKEETPDGTPVSGFTLPNDKAVKGSTTDPTESEQWTGWRELSDTEIEELAIAMVKQVKLRGPFLSLSEFVNRRLDSSNKELSVKGALQAGLDDEKVSINAGFRSPNRVFSSAETRTMSPKFSEALEGPVAYGSAAYVDQADVLRNFAGQLTPRGDTFVIRTYGDSLDARGKVKARAWCEAVVQRFPNYLDPKDESHLKHADLTSEANKTFGRKLRIVSFRWLNQSEI